MKVYWAKFKYGGPTLIEVEVAKENALTYVPLYTDGNVLLGEKWNRYVGKRIYKNDHVFETQAQAATWLRQAILVEIAAMKEKIEELTRYGEELADMENAVDTPVHGL